MILAGEVQVAGMRADKAGTPILSDAKVQVASRHQKYVSRGGFKLEGALRGFSIDPTNLVCLDVGSSHGGFTDCLLQHGAARVYAIDVNVEQLDWKLRQDGRVVPVKRNARELRAENIPELVDLVVIDVSFISVQRVIAPAITLAKPGAVFVILIKPQFELPRKSVGPGGIVKLVRKPRLPMLIGRIGMRRGAAKRAAASMVPSPPRTSRSSEASATTERDSPFEPAGKAAAVSSSRTALIPRSWSHFNKGGTTTESCSRRGRERMPML